MTTTNATLRDANQRPFVSILRAVGVGAALVVHRQVIGNLTDGTLQTHSPRAGWVITHAPSGAGLSLTVFDRRRDAIACAELLAPIDWRMVTRTTRRLPLVAGGTAERERACALIQAAESRVFNPRSTSARAWYDAQLTLLTAP